MRQKLPKQWKHWCQTAGLKPYGKKGQAAYQWFYLKGHGHVWRLNCHGRFECGDTCAKFDRWALCQIEDAPAPRNMLEFNAFVHMLLQRKRSNAGAQPTARGE